MVNNEGEGIETGSQQRNVSGSNTFVNYSVLSALSAILYPFAYIYTYVLHEFVSVSFKMSAGRMRNLNNVSLFIIFGVHLSNHEWELLYMCYALPSH